MDAIEFVATRTRLRLSQAAIAAALGVDQATISRWESAKARIPGPIELALATLQQEISTMPSPRPRVLVADPISGEGVEMLRAVADVDVNTGLAPDALIAIIGQYQGLVVRSETKVTRALLEAGTKLEVVGRAGVGVDNIDLLAATERGVIVVNAPQGNTIAATEHTVALLMSLARHIPQADATMRAGKWARKDYVGTELRGKTLGIVGLGKIGVEVARRAIALEMDVIGYDPFVPDERARALGLEPVDFDSLITRSDFITVHVPLSATNTGLLGAEQIARMKTGVRLINVARGGIIDEQALADAVKSGKVAGAAIDVFTDEPVKPDNPLLGDPRIITTPHLGASTSEAQERVALDVAEQLVDVFNGRPARYAVNAPMLVPETLKVVGPYMAVAEAVGSVATQLVTGKLTAIAIDYYGEIAEHDVRPLRASVIRGLLKPISVENVNIVNANIVAQARGWNIDEKLRSSHDVFVNLIDVRVMTTDAEVSVSGTVEHGHAHIVSINGLDVDLQPAPGAFLVVIDNDDKPGMIGRVGTLMGSFDINIQSMQVGRKGPRERAIMLLTVDESPTEAQLAAIAAIDGMFNVRLVRL